MGYKDRSNRLQRSFFHLSNPTDMKVKNNKQEMEKLREELNNSVKRLLNSGFFTQLSLLVYRRRIPVKV